MGETPLEIRHLSKRFGAVDAVRDLTLSLGEPAIVGLIGPNGSGKTTLINLISGDLLPSGGEIAWKGRRISRAPAHQRARLGIGRTFQQTMTFPELSVDLNLRIAAEAVGRGAHAARVPESISSVLESYAGVPARELPFGVGRLLGVALALVGRPEFLALDEPAAGLTETDRNHLAQILRDISAQGISVLIVDHDMGFLMPLCARVVVMDAGRLVADGDPKRVQKDPKVIEIYFGAGAHA